MNPNYPKYGIDGSLVECANVVATTTADVPSANQMACAVAMSRSKKAVLRVGGGELFDEAYRAVSFEWNEANPDRPYHLVGGGAGTVSAAGGWMASGGLSGTTGMRMYGLGIDNVVALEMILPNGQHVRLAPTSWSGVDDGYTTTEIVTGYCNTNSEANETLWEWGDCDPVIDFNELWFAARGGGGGTFGIVTSLHYQLHDSPGPLQYLFQNPGIFPADAASRVSEEAAYVLATKHIEFLLRFLYSPESLNATQFDSRNCNSAQTANLSPYTGGLFFCYGSSGTVMAQNWADFISDSATTNQLFESGVPSDIIDLLPGFYQVQVEYDSYAAGVLASSSDNTAIPEGRLADSPLGSIVPLLSGFPNLGDSLHTHIPLAAVQADPVGMSQLLALDMGPIYAMGGMVPMADDGMNSLSPTRRTAAFLMGVKNAEIRDAIFDLAYGELTGDFPGSSCHNHALIFDMGPLKTNWSVSCPTEWPQDEREEKCLSTQTAAWGSANLARLEAFKAEIDPNNLFICASGVGYSNPTPAMANTTRPPTAAPMLPVVTDQPTVAPTSGALSHQLLHSLLVGLLLARFM